MMKQLKMQGIIMAFAICKSEGKEEEEEAHVCLADQVRRPMCSF